MIEARLYLLQRASALVLAPLVLLHLGLVVYAVRGGLTAGEILGRTQGSLGWGLLYGLFVLAVAVHAPIGLRTVLKEMTPLPPRACDGIVTVALVGILWMGFRAVFALYGAGA